MALSSAVLLVASFPNWHQPWGAWVALVPWLVVLTSLKGRQAFWWSFLVGLAFFLGSMAWLTQLRAFGGWLAIIGWVALCAYLALYFGAFGWLTRQCLVSNQQSAISNQQKGVFAGCSPVVMVASFWVALEYLRSHLLSGLGWNLLGYSQTPALTAIQIADVTGVWGVSFVVVAMNVAIARFVTEAESRKAVPSVMIAAALVLATWSYGRHRLTAPLPPSSLKVAVIQGNIPQEEKWDESRRTAILDRYERLTVEAATQHPDLIVWPETAVPGFLGLDPAITTRVQSIVRSVDCPLLVGAPMWRRTDQGGALNNSAVLLHPDGPIVERYDKIHLVPFGEFIPGETAMPWLRNMLPPIGEFVPGRRLTVFEMPDRVWWTGGRVRPTFHVPPLSVLICFEDMFPELARRFVREGAQLLVTITNDAWFGKTAAAYQHTQASTFRAVELRVPMIRAANTGWSGCIDPTGRWVASVHEARGGELFVEGVASCDVSPGHVDTLYLRWGDWFAWLCLLGCLGWAIFAIMKR